MSHKKAANENIERLRELCAQAEDLRNKAAQLCTELEKRIRVVSEEEVTSRKEPRSKRGAR
jgi:hypothetical protein